MRVRWRVIVVLGSERGVVASRGKSRNRQECQTYKTCFRRRVRVCRGDCAADPYTSGKGPFFRFDQGVPPLGLIAPKTGLNPDTTGTRGVFLRRRDRNPRGKPVGRRKAGFFQ